MLHARILLLDFHSASDLALSLQAILGSPRLFAATRRECLNDRRAASLDSLLSTINSEWSPNLIFLLLPSALLRRARSLLHSIKRQASNSRVAIVVETAEPDVLVELVNDGADEFFIPPLRSVDILPRTCRLLERADPAELLVENLERNVGLKQLIGESPVLSEQIRKIPMVAKTNCIVLISGETGTGKELFARAIHYLSPRANKPFVPINCGAIPMELVENELFGHQRGAFTGASAAQRGLIDEAQGGTLFLDEVDCLPLLAQVKMLRFLQEKEYRPLGSARMRRADVRVIAAANGDLEQAVKNGSFREDFYYRLNIIPFVLPPLRERREDIPALAHHFLERYCIEFGKDVIGFAPEAMQRLAVYNWPGNVRELQHMVERAVVLTEQPLIQECNLVFSRTENIEPQSLRQAKAKVVECFEKSYIQGLLTAYNGNITKAAQAAKKNRRAFWQLIRKNRIDVERFKSKAS